MKRIILMILPTLLLLAGCGSQSLEADGRAEVLLTDAPATEADTLPVTFSRIELVGEAESAVSVSVEPQTIDVLTLRNGGLETLGETDLPAGTYNQLRLIVDDAEITFAGGSEVHPVEVPSGAQTGLKINIEPALVVEGGQTSQVVLDFDAARAVVETGNGEYVLKPTAIRAVTSSGTAEGSVVEEGGTEGEPGLPLAGALIVVYDQEGNVVTTTITEADGSFRLITLPEGNYDFEVSLAGYASTTIQDVAVASGEVTAMGELELTVAAAP